MTTSKIERAEGGVVTFNGKPVSNLSRDELDQFWDERHRLANEHPLYTKAERKVERAIASKRKAMNRRAEKLREKAQKLLDEASDLEWAAQASERSVPEFHTLRREIEEDAYWTARKAIGLG